MALLRRLSFIMIFIGIIGCGGGDGGFSDGGGTTPGTGGDGTTDDIVISLTISDQLVTEQAPATITATVTQGDTTIAGTVVTFTTTLGIFNPETGTALTDANGVATIVLNSGEVAGAGTVTASITSGESSEPVGFTTQGTSETIVRIGSGEPASFSEGTIDLSLAQISAGSTTTISVILVDDTGALFAEAVDVNFTSVCAEETIPTAEIDSVVKTSSGMASANYLAKGCVGDDPITVNTVINGQNLSATGSVNVLPADVGSIEFVSATPEHIAIKGTGTSERPEAATVVFKVLDTNGNPVNNQNVNFTLSSDSGEIQLIPTSATTNNQGLAQTVVNSGTVARTVRVIAQVDDGSDPVKQTQSSELKVSTGVPDQDSTSISVDVYNPEAWAIDGAEVNVTIRLADAFNNPPPPTAVVFTTEGGSIETLDATCITNDSGACSVIWRSQEPKPEGQVLSFGSCYSQDSSNPTVGCAHYEEYLGQKYGGRTTILATTIGEESFPDLNGNGRFDECEVPAFTGGVGKPCNADGSFDLSGDDITYSGNDVGGDPYDLDEAHLEHNEDWIFNPAQSGGMTGGELEEPVDFNKNLIFDTKDGMYNGVLCALPKHDGCSQVESLDVRDSAVIVMSGSNAYFTTISPLSADGTIPTLVIQGDATNSASVVISDLHNQQMPMGSTVEFIATVGSVVDGGGNWPNSAWNGGLGFGVVVKGETEPKQGSLIVKVTTPSGVISSHTVAFIDIQ